jgi:hypothetical protein
VERAGIKSFSPLYGTGSDVYQNQPDVPCLTAVGGISGWLLEELFYRGYTVMGR